MNDLETRAGRQLYDLLPEVYRSRDDGSLAAWVDAAGDLLDLVRNTLEQRLADSFPDEPFDGRACQDWLLPYFADLLEPRLISSDPQGQRAEVANAIAWRQRKGTLVSAEQIAQEVGQIEAEVQEGWKRVAVTPRIGGSRPAAPLEAGKPWAAELPVGTVDFGFQSRALAADADDPAAHLTRFGGQVVPWRQAYPSGAPAFPGSYEDASAVTVDLRTPEWRRGHAHPRRILFYYPPQGGFFPPGAPRVDWLAWASRRSSFEIQCGQLDARHLDNLTYTDGTETVFLQRLPGPEGEDVVQARKGGALIAERITEVDGRVRSRLLLADRWLERSAKPGEPVTYRGDGQPVVLTTTDPVNTLWFGGQEMEVAFEDLSLDATIRNTLAGARMTFRRSAARAVYLLTQDTETPVIDAVDSLFDHVAATEGLIRLEYTTVLSELNGRRLQVSDSLLLGQLTLGASGKVSVLRYSRLPQALEGTGLLQSFNTLEPPLFVELDFIDAGKPVRRAANFGEPGAGVLHPEAPRSIRLGAEDGGEMGAYHGRRYSLAAEAVRNKLEDYLPVGTEAVLIPDPRLLTPPPAG
ncbi:MAG TPA: hypothetical protein VF173_23770 [Thermoanaerobaculia bacterium]|nr:hypothetical protein [Thermoanaerobaculia bacterium]